MHGSTHARRLRNGHKTAQLLVRLDSQFTLLVLHGDEVAIPCRNTKVSVPTQRLSQNDF